MNVRMKNIGIIINALTLSGGGERIAVAYGREFLRRGYRVSFYTREFDPTTCFPEEVAGFKVRTLSKEDAHIGSAGKIPLIGRFVHLWREIQCAKKLARLVARDEEVLQPHDMWSARVAHYAKKRLPHAVSVFVLNDVHTASWSLFDDPLFGGKQKSAWKKPWYWLVDAVDRMHARSQDMITVLNYRSVPIVKKYLGCKSVVVRSGVDLEHFPYKARAPLVAGKTINILSHGIFFVHRRYEDIISALALLRERGIAARLTIVGDYAYRDVARAYYQKLLSLIAAQGLQSQVVFTGQLVGRQAVGKAYHDSDLYVSATHMQTWGLATFEALATGLPSIICETVGAAEVLVPDKYALLIPPGNPAAIASAVTRLISEPSLYQALGREGAAFVRGALSWEKCADEMLTVFESAWKRRNVPSSTP